MAIVGVGVDEPFYFGASDEAVIEHDGVAYYIKNDTGKTLFTDKTDPHLTLDHAQKFTGIYTASPAFPLHMTTTGTNAAFIFERTAGAIGLANATDSAATFGTVNNHPVRILTNSITKLTIDTAGNITAPAAYTTTIGGTNTDLYIDNTGLIGPLPSSEIFKENIRTLTIGDTDWIYNLTVKKCDYLDGTMDIITIMAEEAATINPGLARYALYDNESGKMIDRADYSNVPEIIESLEMGTATGVELIKNETEVIINKTVQKRAITVNRSDLIYPILAELQKLKIEVDILKQ